MAYSPTQIPDPHFLGTASQAVGLFLSHYIKPGLDWKRLASSALEPLQVGSAQIFLGIVSPSKNFAFTLSSVDHNDGSLPFHRWTNG